MDARHEDARLEGARLVNWALVDAILARTYWSLAKRGGLETGRVRDRGNVRHRASRTSRTGGPPRQLLFCRLPVAPSGLWASFLSRSCGAYTWGVGGVVWPRRAKSFDRERFDSGPEY